jgi:hypothetical protein
MATDVQVQQGNEAINRFMGTGGVDYWIDRIALRNAIDRAKVLYRYPYTYGRGGFTFYSGGLPFASGAGLDVMGAGFVALMNLLNKIT